MNTHLPFCLKFIVTGYFVLFGVISFSQTVPKEFKLAIVQMYVEPGNLEKNLSNAGQLIREAAANKADVILLPEVMDLGWTHPSAKEFAYAIPDGKTCQQLCRMAKANHVYLCCGMVEKDGSAIYNSAVIIDNKGKVLIKHRKLNELDIAHDLYAQGDRLGVCSTPWGTFGLMICADGTAKDHVLARSLGYMGADVILSPSSWAVPPDHDNLKDPYGKTWFDAYIPVASEFALWIVSASNVGPVTEGPWKNWKCIGCSMVIGPDGKEKLIGPYGEKAEKILYCTIKPTPRPARGTGWYNFSPEK
ncbi:MAG TPA: carbon-nitrogen hydrolase family protein [Prolixibacteraceae bacterium]|nr:carbon-nitrogen hydrolase family protein [Prolixibacteraceae bacterium]